jgi:hypothetical protein
MIVFQAFSVVKMRYYVTLLCWGTSFLGCLFVPLALRRSRSLSLFHRPCACVIVSTPDIRHWYIVASVWNNVYGKVYGAPSCIQTVLPAPRPN